MLFKLSTNFRVFQGNFFRYHDFRQKSGHKIKNWSERAKNFPKSCRKLQIFLFTIQQFKYYWIFQYNFVSSEKTYLRTMSSSQKVVIEPTSGMKEANIQILPSAKSNTIRFFNTFLSFSAKANLSIKISRKKVVIETNIWSKQDKSLPKNCGNLQIFILTMQ